MHITELSHQYLNMEVLVVEKLLNLSSTDALGTLINTINFIGNWIQYFSANYGEITVL